MMEYKEIDEWIVQFQAGQEDAGEILLRAFGGHPGEKSGSSFIGKYHALLRDGTIDFANYDMRKFLCCFIEDKEMRRRLLMPRQNVQVRQYAARKAQELAWQMEHLGEEDLWQELRLLFLIQANRYEFKKRHFTAYLYGSYRFAVARFVNRMAREKQAEGYMMKRLSEDVCIGASGIGLSDLALQEDYVIASDDEIGQNWVRGLQCGEVFQDLSVMERLILKLNYVDKLSDREIAEKIGYHINTVFRKRQKAIRRIEASLHDES